MDIKISDNEYWWCGVVNDGHNMPFGKDSVCGFDLNGGRENDQFTPLMLSSGGRYVWSDKSFKVFVKNGTITLEGDADFELSEGHKNLKGAYLAAMQKHFPFQSKMPDELFWRAPQYNTWIELGTEQRTDKILEYAKGILSHGLEAGILMIDGGWQEDYGVFDFHRGKIPDPKYLIDSLHEMGFKVMLWVSPIVASAGPNYKKIRDKGYLVKNADGSIAIRQWWSGYSAVLDFTNPAACAWYRSELDRLMEDYGVDGFKFDAGDTYFYKDDDITYESVPAREQTKYYNIVGEDYALNEFRAAWNCGGHPIAARLHDKYHTWDDFGLNTIIPHTILQGLLGYAYCCPDMVGGGIIDCFGTSKQLDEELFVRWAQVNTLMGMMQVSAAPWRVLSAENTQIVTDMIKLHGSMGDVFYDLARKARDTGEPIVRHMAYVFPDEGFELIDVQFMLGNDILVAPVTEKGAKTKSVRLPKGRWADLSNRILNGGTTLEIPVEIKDLIYFKRV